MKFLSRTIRSANLPTSTEPVTFSSLSCSAAFRVMVRSTSARDSDGASLSLPAYWGP
ncbi:hypothetical protein D3C73_1626830 [compost metagenome]